MLRHTSTFGLHKADCYGSAECEAASDGESERTKSRSHGKVADLLASVGRLHRASSCNEWLVVGGGGGVKT